MDPSSFTKTSFCNIEIDNITTNEAKEYILNQLSIHCGGIKYNSRYAKVFNPQYSQNLNNPHVFFLKSSGTPYLLFMSQINGINYSFFIDKKVKEGYSYPKIFILPYQFSSELYKGSLFECELIRKKNKKWTIGINDTYALSGKNLKKTIIIDRVNMITDVVMNNYTENNFSSTCPLFVKKYFDYKEIQYACNEFAPSLGYDIRGIYFTPLRVDYSKILYVFKHGGSSNSGASNGGTSNGGTSKGGTSNGGTSKGGTSKGGTSKGGTSKGGTSKGGSSNSSKGVTKLDVGDNTDATAKKMDTKCFRIMKTMKPDVYELYLSDGDNLVKKGIALVQTTYLSHLLLSYFTDTSYDTEILVKCLYNDNFKKWAPITLATGPIDSN